MGKTLNQNPGEYAGEALAEKDAEIARLKQDNVDLQAHVDHLKESLDACLAQLPETSSV